MDYISKIPGMCWGIPKTQYLILSNKKHTPCFLNLSTIWYENVTAAISECTLTNRSAQTQIFMWTGEQTFWLPTFKWWTWAIRAKEIVTGCFWLLQYYLKTWGCPNYQKIKLEFNNILKWSKLQTHLKGHKLTLSHRKKL